MRQLPARSLLRISLCLLAAAQTGCVFRTVEIETVQPRTGYDVRTPIKAHLVDGRTIVFPDGARVENGSLRGSGRSFDLTVQFAGPVSGVALDSLVGLETFRTDSETGKTVAFTTLAVAGTVTAVGLAAVAIFGSCPTVYSDSAGTPYLETETFSYSIAPIFEGRDLDRLRARPGPDGRLRLEVRNEALETHYLNQFSLLEVAHPSDAFAAPDERGSPVVLRGPLPVVGAVDEAGRDVLEALARRDGRTFRTDPGMFEAMLEREGPAGDDLRDAIELEIPVPDGVEEIGLLLTLRNSLFSTVLFYDVMLARQGARALDWLGTDLDQIGRATQLGLWVVENLGLRVDVWDGEAWRPAGRLPDTGPIAWKDVALALPTTGGPSMRVRLSFPLDSWDIDHVTAFAEVRPETGRRIDPTRVVDSSGSPLAGLVSELRTVDRRYLVTGPGQHFVLEFETGPAELREARTYFLASQGYYEEWIRPAWIAASPGGEPFEPGDLTLLEALRRWRTEREHMEAGFFTSRVPIGGERREAP